MIWFLSEILTFAKFDHSGRDFLIFIFDFSTHYHRAPYLRLNKILPWELMQKVSCVPLSSQKECSFFAVVFSGILFFEFWIYAVCRPGEKIRDHMRNIVPILLDQNVTINDKIRFLFWLLAGVFTKTPSMINSEFNKENSKVHKCAGSQYLRKTKRSF